MTSPRRALALFGVSLAVLRLVAATAWAADPASPNGAVAAGPAAPAAGGAGASEPLRFRRVFAPVDQLPAWPFQNETYLPLPGGEFEDLVRRAEAAVAAESLPSGAEVVECRYTARYDGDAHVAGTGEIDLRRRADDPRVVRLSPFSLAAFQVRWKQGGEAARLGSAAGDALLMVDRNDTLLFDFKQRVVRESAETVSLTLDFPNCPAAVLELELPQSYDVQRGDYIIQPGGSVGTGLQRWTIRSTGGRLRVRFGKRGNAVVQAKQNGVRIESAYDFTERGVELTAQLRIDALHSPLENITLELDHGLTLVDARLPDRRLAWFAVPAAPGAIQRYVLDFERPLEGAGRTLFLKAVAPLVIGRKHPLPTLRAPALFWQHATLTLSVPAPLEIVRIDPRESVFTNPVPLAGSRPGEAVELQCFSAAGGADLLLERRIRPIDAATVTKWRLLEEEVLAEFHGELRVDVGKRFTLEASLPARWVVDSVAASPATALADWTLSDAQEKQRTLTLRLAQPLASDRPLRLTITGRLKHHNAGDHIARDQLRFIEFRDTLDRRSLTALRGEDGLRLQLRDADGSAAVVAADRLDPVRRELLGDFAPDYLLAATEAWELDVLRQALDFTADTQVTASVEADRLLERYRFRLRNEDRQPLQRVRVRFAPAKPEALEWTLGDRRRGQISAERVAPAAAGSGEEVWEVVFRKPPTGDIELAAERSSPRAPGAAVSLAALVDAAAQTGTVQIEADAALPLRVVNRSLTPLPAPAAEGGRERLRGVYRYQPEQAATKDAPPLGIVRPSENSAPLPKALVWSIRYDSKYDAGRRLSHRATLYIQALAAGRCRLALDEPAELTAVRINGVAAAHLGPREWSLPLTEEAGLICLEVDFRTSDLAAGRLRMLELPVVRIDVPVLFTTRDVALPLSFDVPADAGLRSLRTDWSGSWLRRLFGPLAPTHSLGSFSWWRGENAATADRPTLTVTHRGRSGGEASLLNSALGTTARTLFTEEHKPTWAELWSETQKRYSTPERAPLKFDVPALNRLGIVPTAAVTPPPTVYDDVAELGEQILTTAGLVVAYDGRNLVLTSASSAYGGDEDALRVFAPQLLSRNIADVAGVMSLEDWTTLPPGAWSSFTLAPSLFAGEPFGQEYVVPTEGDTWGIWIIRREIPPLVALAFVAVAFVVGRKLYIGKRWLLAPLIGLSGAAAAALPDWVGVPAASTLLGLAAGAALCIVLPPRTRERSTRLGVGADSTSKRQSGRSSTARAAGASLLLLLTLPDSPACGQQAPRPPAAPSAPAILVFIPTDAAGKPNGERFQVPQRLLKDLQTRAARNEASTVPALVQKARYAAVVGRDIEQTRFVVTELQATFELYVLQAGAVVTLPFGMPGAGGTVAGTLDGRIVDLGVATNGQALTFEAPNAGPVRLELVFKPGAPAAGAPSGFSLTVPRVSDAELKIAVPSEIAGLGVAQAAEALNWNDSRREATVRLTPADKLSLSWSDATTAPTQSSAVDQLTWLRVRSGSIVLDLRLVVRPPAGGLREVVLLADPRLQWLPKRAQGSPVSNVEQTPITSEQATVGQRIRVEFSRPIVKEETVEVSFLLTGAAGIGSLRLPELRLAEAVPGVRRFAYSVDPLLVAGTATDAGMKPLAVPEFMKAWGQETALPQAAYELTSSEPAWTLTARPKAPTVRARQTQTIVCGKRRLEVLLEAEIDVADGLIFHHELQIPPGLEVASIDVAEVGDNSGGRVGRWSHDVQGKLMVFLRAPISDKHRLTLRGSLALPASGESTLPLVAMLSAQSDERLIRIARLPEVLASAVDLKQLVVLPADTGDSAAGNARVVEILRVDGAKPAGRLKVVDNPQTARARLVSTYVPEGKSWQYELQITLDVGAGLLDEVLLELPTQVATPLAITPSMPYEVIASGNSVPRLLRVRPRQAIAGHFEFALQAALAEARRDESVPIARVRRIGVVEQFLRLPKHAGLSPIRWETSQLSVDDNFKPTGKPTGGQEFETYRVSGPDPAAVLRSVRGAGGRPYVRQVEHRILPHSDGSLIGLSSFLVEPAGSQAGVLRAPQEMELLLVTTGGAVVSPERTEDGAWRISFASEQMPHAVDVLYRRLPESGPATGVVLPHWDNLRAERSLVSTYSDERGPRCTLGNLAPSTKLRAGEEPLAALDAAIADLSVDGSSAAADWLAPLVRRRSDVVHRLRLDINAESETPDSRTAREFVANSEQQFKAKVSLVDAGAGVGGLFDLPALWHSAYADECDSSFLVVAGEAAPLQWQFLSREQDADWRFVYVPLGCLLLVIAGRWFAAVDGFLRWPQLCGVLFGTAWILFLQPTLVGWLILGVVVACRLHPSLRHVRERTLSLSPKLSGLRKS